MRYQTPLLFSLTHLLIRDTLAPSFMHRNIMQDETTEDVVVADAEEATEEAAVEATETVAAPEAVEATEEAA